MAKVLQMGKGKGPLSRFKRKLNYFDKDMKAKHSSFFQVLNKTTGLV